MVDTKHIFILKSEIEQYINILMLYLVNCILVRQLCKCDVIVSILVVVKLMHFDFKLKFCLKPLFINL